MTWSRLTSIRTSFLWSLLLFVALGCGLWWHFSESVSNPDSSHELAAETPHVEPESRRQIASGLYRQRLAPGESGERLLSVISDGQGQLILSFDGVSAFILGADKVTINTTWQLAEEHVTFTLLDGVPDVSYQRLVLLTLEKVTRFHIDDFQVDSLTLRRVTDGEIFHWEKISESSLSVSPES